MLAPGTCPNLWVMVNAGISIFWELSESKKLEDLIYNIYRYIFQVLKPGLFGVFLTLIMYP